MTRSRPALEPYRSLDHVVDVELVAQPDRSIGPPGVLRCRRPGQHPQPAVLGQRRDDVVGQPLGEVVPAGLRRQIGERQHRQHRVASLSPRLRGRRRGVVVHRGDEHVAPAVHRLDDALVAASVTDGAAQLLDLRGERRLAHEPVTPHRVEQLRLGDDLVAMVDQLDQDPHRLRLQGHRLAVVP